CIIYWMRTASLRLPVFQRIKLVILGSNPEFVTELLCLFYRPLIHIRTEI
ncbi:hypothetical protein L9F63_003737, partial [Diploptera punctata]